MRSSQPYQPKPIFQSRRFPRYVSIQEARDAYETCRRIHDREDRMSTYEVFGVDGETVEKYLHTVEAMSASLDNTERYEQFLRCKYIRIGPFHIFIDFKF